MPNAAQALPQRAARTRAHACARGPAARAPRGRPLEKAPKAPTQQQRPHAGTAGAMASEGGFDFSAINGSMAKQLVRDMLAAFDARPPRGTGAPPADVAAGDVAKSGTAPIAASVARRPSQADSNRKRLAKALVNRGAGAEVSRRLSRDGGVARACVATTSGVRRGPRRHLGDASPERRGRGAAAAASWWRRGAAAAASWWGRGAAAAASW